MRLLKLTFSIVAAMAFSSAANAQYREGQPPTLDPPPPAPDAETVAVSNFGPAYRRAGTPRIVIFWNRHFDDEVASRYRQKTEYEQHNHDDGAVHGSITTGDERISSKRRDLVTEPVDWDMEGAFNSAMTGSGARLVDRASIMRIQGVADGAEERANVQGIETRAITDKADIIVEILSSADSRAIDGISYRVVAKDVRNAVVLADFTTSGRPPARQMPYVAGPNGFERARQPEPGPEDIGRQLAVELMQALTRNWR
jgi:hypothetical protein